MPAERSQLYYTCVFLQVSFQAVQNSVGQGSREDNTPCWLDAEMLKMLLRELKRCRESASPFADVHTALNTATYHCGLLMAQCPGALDQQLCLYHLEAITLPLREAVTRLSGHSLTASQQGVPAGQRLRNWLRR
ncbi:hypothetical protein [Salinicola avicenniae]|uniref:hypothetical protein n=1 Tax=Salinicola avicenniae TaxID=2916836 RepID=UPI0020742B24|nr:MULTISPECIES: hypothetical protein [unclassified Salinicola]